MDVVYLDLSKAYDTLSHNIFPKKLRPCGINEWSVRQMENWPTVQAQRAVISATESGWRAVPHGTIRTPTQEGPIHVPLCFFLLLLSG